jgi:hypothetical protein
VTTATARTAAAPRRAAAERPPLRLVPPRQIAAGRAPFVALVTAVLVSGLVGLLVLHTAAAQDAFRLHDLQRQSATLADTEQQLAVATQQQQAPESLAARARALGMVPTGSIAFMRLRHGRIVGVAKAAPAPLPPPVAAPSPSPSASATTTAAAATATSSAGSAAKHRGPRSAHQHR